LIFQDSIVDIFLKPLADLAALFVLLLGVIWIIYGLHEGFRRKSFRKLTKVDDWDFDITKFLKVLTLAGFIVGIFSIITGAGALILDYPPSIAYATKTANAANLYTCIFLIVLGLFTFLKPLNDLPIASMIGLAAAVLVCAIIAMLIPDSAVKLIENFIDPKIVLIIIFLIIFAIVAITVKFYMAALMFISKVISWPPFAFIIAIFCFIQGFALLIFGVSIL